MHLLLIADARELERARLFGEKGDLSIRRDGDVFQWRLIGEQGMQPPAAYATDAHNFFCGPDAGTRWLRGTDTALLWGVRKPNQSLWFEDRVARATLDYPEPVSADRAWRVRVHYWTFSRGGQIEFVWFTQLEKIEEVANA